MSDESNWLKNPVLPRPPAVPRFKLAELDSVPDEDRRLVTSTCQREYRRQRARRHSGTQLASMAVESGAPEARPRMALRRIA